MVRGRHLCAELLHRDEGANGEDEVVDKLVGGLGVQEAAHHLGRLGRVDLLHIPLDVAQHVVGVQVVRQVRHHVKAVAHVDQRPARHSLAPQCFKEYHRSAF